MNANPQSEPTGRGARGGRLYERLHLGFFFPTLILLLSFATFAAGQSAEETRLYRTAKATFSDGLYEVSAQKWSELLQKFPKTRYEDECLLLWGESLVRLNKPAEAAKLLEDRLSRGKLDERWSPGFFFWSGEARLKMQDFAAAEKHYQQFLKEHPTHFYRGAAFYGLAVALFKQSKFRASDEALANVEESVKRIPIPDTPGAKAGIEDMMRHAALLRGELLLAGGRPDAAEGIFKELVAKNATHSIRLDALRWWGESLLRRDQWSVALEKFRAMLDAKEGLPNPLKTEAFFGSGVALMRLDKNQEAADAFAEAFKIAEGDELRRQLLTKRAAALVAAGKKAEAVEELRVFAEKNSKDTLADSALLWAADLQYDQKNFADALKLYQTLYSQFPASPLSPAAHNRAGWCLLALKRAADSVTEFTQAAKASDARIGAESQLKLADALFSLGRDKLEDALAAYNDYVARFPEGEQRDDAQYQAGVCAAQLGKTDAAIAAFSAVADREPPGALAERAAYEVARVYVQAQEFARARGRYYKFLQQYGGSPLAVEARLAATQTFLYEGKYAEGIQKFDDFLKDFPKHAFAPRAAYDRAWCYYQMGDLKKAFESFSELLQQYPDAAQAPDAKAWIAEYYFGRKEFKEAQETFAALAQAYPSTEWAETALYMAGRSAARREDWVGAFQELEKLLKKYPDSRLQNDALFLQADCRMSLSQFENALALFEIIVAKIPETPLGLSALGRKGDCLFTLQHYDEAANVFRRLAENPRADVDLTVEARYKLARCLEKQNKLDEAYIHYVSVVYGWLVDDKTRGARNDVWFCRAAFDGARLAKARGQPREAQKMLQRVIDAGASAREEAEQEVRRIMAVSFDLR